MAYKNGRRDFSIVIGEVRLRRLRVDKVDQRGHALFGSGHVVFNVNNVDRNTRYYLKIDDYLIKTFRSNAKNF